MHIRLQKTPFDPWQYLSEQQIQHERDGVASKSGATAVFVGTMRDFNQGDDVVSMYLEHYPGMTLRQLETIAAEAKQQWNLDDVMIVHRVGKIEPAHSIVLVAVWSAHRAEAFSASRHIMEVLKHTAPFWKQETLSDGSQRWVEKNTLG